MYLSDQSVYVDETALSSVLCGASRPGHFRGVCTVVTKLFNLLAPNAAVFGEKDYQQLALVRRMTRDLNFKIEIIGVPTVREADGLALSSRNQYLDADERAQAALLRRAALGAQQLVETGERSAEKLIAAAKQVIATGKSTRIDYINLVDSETLQPLTVLRPNALLALAVFVGRTRLIDNLRLA
jgi:pantoate--beta-alanine ligase